MEEVLPLEDFVRDDLPKPDNKELFYATALESFDPIADWKKAHAEIAETGQSSLLNIARQKWEKEQDTSAKNAITGLMQDKTIPEYQKVSAINTYIAGNFIEESLRNKYLVKTAVKDEGMLEADRQAQEIMADTLYKRDAENQAKELEKKIKDAHVDFFSVLKGTAAFASRIPLVIPMGYAALYSLLKEQKPEEAAAILKTINDWGYSPDDVGSQKVIGAFQKAAEFLDIPFKWLGDKTFDITGSPLAATSVYSVAELVGYYGAGLGALKAGKAAFKSVSPISTTNTASKPAAGRLVAAAIADDTNRLASALDTTTAELVKDFVVSPTARTVTDIPNRPDILDKLTELDNTLSSIATENKIDPAIYPITELVQERAKYIDIMTQAQGPKLLQSQSPLEFQFETTQSYIKSSSLFGRNADYGYTTQFAADMAKHQMEQSASILKEPGKFEVVQKGPEYFVKWDFKREYDPLAKLTMGDAALSSHLLFKNFDITKLANSVVGRQFWPSFMRMKTWIPSIAGTAGWKEAQIKGRYLQAQRDLVYLTPDKSELSKILLKGKEQGIDRYNKADIRAEFPHLSEKRVEDLYGSYLGFRQIQDYLYTVSDSKFRYLLEKEEYKTLYSPVGQRIGFVKVKPEEKIPVKEIWDYNLNAPRPRTNTDELIQLKDAVEHNGNLYNYAVLGTNKTGPIQPGSLTKVPGYIATHYKEHWVLDREPTKLKVDGNDISPEKLREYRRAVAMSGTKADILKLKADFQQNFPNHTFHERLEKKNIEDTIMFDSKIYEQYFSEHQKLGKRLPSLNRLASIEDVLVSQTKSIMAVARLQAWEPYMEHVRKTFVKDYGEFTNHKFPEQISDIHPIDKRMTPAETQKYKAAQEVYRQLEFQQFSTLPSEELWRSGAGVLADTFEKIKIPELSPVLRDVGDKGVIPVKAAKALGSHMFLYLRPQRMMMIQPQQMFELSLIEKAFIPSVLEEMIPLWRGLLGTAHTLRPLAPTFTAMGRKSVKDYDAILAAMKDSGIMQAVDTNQMIHGIWKDSLEELVPGKFNKAWNPTKKVLGFPSKVGRAVGYDAFELLNQTSLWLFSQKKWIRENPGKDWNTPENIAEIAQMSYRIGHGSSGRAGMLPMQEGMLSLFSQFIAIPHKSFMQMISSPDFTGLDKARLLAARLFWYGRWGVPGGNATTRMLAQNMDKETEEKWDSWTRGMNDAIMNKLWSILFGKTDAYWSKSLSTVPESVFIYDVIHTLWQMGTEGEYKGAFPFQNAGTSLFTTVRKVWDMYNIPTYTGKERDWGKIAWTAASFAGTLSDINKAMFIEHITKHGQNYGNARTAGDISASLLGIQGRYETVLFEAFQDIGKRNKLIKDTATEFNDRLMQLKGNGTIAMDEYWEGAKAFLSNVDSSYKEEVIREMWNIAKRQQQTLGDSVIMYIYKHYQSENEGHMQDLLNTVNNSSDPKMKEFSKALQ